MPRGSSILVLRLASKSNANDMHEFPSAEIMRLLTELGANASYADPFMPKFTAMRDYAFDLNSLALTPAALAACDCVLLATDHDACDYDMILEHAALILDARARYREKSNNFFNACMKHLLGFIQC